MGKPLSIYEAQDIMRDDQRQFDRTIVKLRGNEALPLLDASELPDLARKASRGQDPQSGYLRKKGRSDA